MLRSFAKLGGPRRAGTFPAAAPGPTGAYAVVAAIPGMIALWDFAEATGTDRLAKFSAAPYPLADEGVADVARVAGGLFSGFSGDFTGAGRLRLPAASLGALNVGATGNAVTVVAWFTRDTSNSGGFVAGIWQEDDGDPRRQYGMFTDLGVYGGADRVCGHVSRLGGASPGLPFSRDYSANRSTLKLGRAHTAAFTYDGSFARSYVDGRLEAFTTYTEPGAPNGDGSTYDKNPYAYPDGLNNAGAIGDFTVGAVLLTSGWGNFFDGQIAGIAVYGRALTIGELAALHRLSIAGDALVDFHFAPDRTSVLNSNLAPIEEGWHAIQTAAGVSTRTETLTTNFRFGNVGGQQFVFRATGGSPTVTSGAGFFFYDGELGGVTTAKLTSLEVTLNNGNIADTLRLAVRIDGAWYASATTLACTAAHASGGDWSTAETKTLAFSTAAAGWRDLTAVVGSSLVLAGAARGADLPSGAVTGIGVYSPSVPTGPVRLRNLRMIVAA